jgi:hypothetical protein
VRAFSLKTVPRSAVALVLFQQQDLSSRRCYGATKNMRAATVAESRHKWLWRNRASWRYSAPGWNWNWEFGTWILPKDTLFRLFSVPKDISFLPACKSSVSDHFWAVKLRWNWASGAPAMDSCIMRHPARLHGCWSQLRGPQRSTLQGQINMAECPKIHVFNGLV